MSAKAVNLLLMSAKAVNKIRTVRQTHNHSYIPPIADLLQRVVVA